MNCDCCGIDRIDKDFINNQKICYRCVYQKKTTKPPKKRKKKVHLCRMCRQPITYIENLKKRQRSIFCSLECAKKGHKELSNNHWTRKVRAASF